jgi:hypothetical protein
MKGGLVGSPFFFVGRDEKAVLTFPAGLNEYNKKTETAPAPN